MSGNGQLFEIDLNARVLKYYSTIVIDPTTGCKKSIYKMLDLSAKAGNNQPEICLPNPEVIDAMTDDEYAAFCNARILFHRIFCANRPFVTVVRMKPEERLRLRESERHRDSEFAQCMPPKTVFRPTRRFAIV